MLYFYYYYVKIKDNGMGDESNWRQLTDEMKKIIKAGRISENCEISRHLVRGFEPQTRPTLRLL